MQVKEMSMALLPPASHLCQVCAIDHDPEQPHNAQSLYYQTKFNMEHGRAATWQDAMEHCSDEVKAAWNERLDELESKGVEVGQRWKSE